MENNKDKIKILGSNPNKENLYQFYSNQFKLDFS